MQSQKQTLIYTMLFLFMILLTMLSSPVWAEEKQWVVFHNNISQDIERFNIILEFTQSSSIFCSISQHGVKSEQIKDGGKKDGYKQQLNLGTAADGNQYVVMLKDASNMNVISQDSDRLCMVKILRTGENKKPVTVKEGLLSFRGEIKIPLEVSPKQLSISAKEPVAGALKISIYSHNPPVYESRFSTTLNGTLSGSTSIKNAFLNTSITCRDSLELKDRYLNLSLKPFDNQMDPVSINGKISDILMLGSAKLVVEKMASDSSELVLALLDGDLAQVPKQEIVLSEGKPFPNFARVELVKRQLMTLDDLKKEAGPDGYVVLIFGDFKRLLPEYFSGRPAMRNLSLDEMMIFDILKKDCKKSMVISFICQQLSLSDLYEKWIGRNPEFHVLSDFSNPLNIQFIGLVMEPRMHRPFDRGETLRGKLKLENEKVITALIDGKGDLVYIDVDAGNKLSGSLVHINNLMKEGKQTEKQD